MLFRQISLLLRKKITTGFIYHSMQRNNSYRDLGLVVAVCVFVCVLVKSLLFGFTWVGIIWLILSCAYFYIVWRCSSAGKLVKFATTLFLVFSVLALVGLLLFDKNARPEMHPFEGTGDTIKDVTMVEEEPIVPIYVMQPEDTLLSDTLLPEESLDSLFIDEESELAPSDTTTIQPTIIQ